MAGPGTIPQLTHGRQHAGRVWCDGRSEARRRLSALAFILTRKLEGRANMSLSQVRYVTSTDSRGSVSIKTSSQHGRPATGQEIFISAKWRSIRANGDNERGCGYTQDARTRHGKLEVSLDSSFICNPPVDSRHVSNGASGLDRCLFVCVGNLPQGTVRATHRRRSESAKSAACRIA